MTPGFRTKRRSGSCSGSSGQPRAGKDSSSANAKGACACRAPSWLSEASAQGSSRHSIRLAIGRRASISLPVVASDQARFASSRKRTSAGSRAAKILDRLELALDRRHPNLDLQHPKAGGQRLADLLRLQSGNGAKRGVDLDR